MLTGHSFMSSSCLMSVRACSSMHHHHHHHHDHHHHRSLARLLLSTWSICQRSPSMKHSWEYTTSSAPSVQAFSASWSLVDHLVSDDMIRCDQKRYSEIADDDNDDHLIPARTFWPVLRLLLLLLHLIIPNRSSSWSSASVSSSCFVDMLTPLQSGRSTVMIPVPASDSDDHMKC
jgi:hypothetical protein